MAQHDLGEVDALLIQQVLRHLRGASVRVGVHRDRRSGADVGLGHRPHHALDAGGQAGRVDRALEERRLHASVGDALL